MNKRVPIYNSKTPFEEFATATWNTDEEEDIGDTTNRKNRSIRFILEKFVISKTKVLLICNEEYPQK